jgi:hypothetical protein
MRAGSITARMTRSDWRIGAGGGQCELLGRPRRMVSSSVCAIPEAYDAIRGCYTVRLARMARVGAGAASNRGNTGNRDVLGYESCSMRAGVDLCAWDR